jgi:hypothetical protein
MRQDSDIEMMLFYDGKDDIAEMRELCAILWNRMTRCILKHGWTYEGKRLLEEATTGNYLVGDLIPEGVPRQGYVPAVEVNALLDADLTKHPHVRDRHLQLLTEVRPVFNSSFANALKKQLVVKNAGPINSVTALVEENKYLPSLLDQYSLDTAENELKTWGDIKTVVYRLLNILSTRLWLAGEAMADDWKLADESSWERFLDGLCAPGIVKTIRFADRARIGTKASRAQSGISLRTNVDLIIDEYAYLLRQLDENEVDPANSKELPKHIENRIRQVVSHFAELFDNMGKVPCFKGAISRANWLAEGSRLRDLGATLT